MSELPAGSRQGGSCGYELQKGQYVVITDAEWEQFKGTLSRTVDILRFVELQEIDPVFFDRTYFLEPADTGEKAYRLLQRPWRDG